MKHVASSIFQLDVNAPSPKLSLRCFGLCFGGKPRCQTSCFNIEDAVWVPSTPRVVWWQGQGSFHERRSLSPVLASRVLRYTRAAFSQEWCRAGGAQTSVNTAVTSGRNTKGFSLQVTLRDHDWNIRPSRLYCLDLKRPPATGVLIFLHHVNFKIYPYDTVLCMCSANMRPNRWDLKMSDVTA